MLYGTSAGWLNPGRKEYGGRYLKVGYLGRICWSQLNLLLVCGVVCGADRVPFSQHATDRTSKVNRFFASFLRGIVSTFTSARKCGWLTEEEAPTPSKKTACKNFVVAGIKKFDIRIGKLWQSYCPGGMYINFNRFFFQACLVSFRNSAACERQTFLLAHRR